jgi:hypothetical protein
VAFHLADGFTFEVTKLLRTTPPAQRKKLSLAHVRALSTPLSPPRAV